MKIKYISLLPSLMLAGLLILVSCSDSSNVDKGKYIVINELMPSNRTGILNDKGKAADWIELKNTSNDSIDLKGFQLQVERLELDSIALAEKEAKKERKKAARAAAAADDEAAAEKEAEKEEKVKEQVMTWSFPAVKIGPGESLVVFASKSKKDENSEAGEEAPAPGRLLSADLKFPKEGGTVRFLTPRGSVIHELKYGAIEPDQSLSMQPDSTYKASYWQSPGFDNTRKGYEAAMLKMEEQRKSPLLIWEVMSRADKSAENWIELKNVSNGDVQLSDYALSKKLGKKEGWQLPSKVLKPGEIVTIVLSGNKARGDLNAPFKLGDSETIVLSKNGKFVDGVCAKSTIIGGSIGRANGQKGFFFYSTPTKNAENGDGGRRFVAESPEFNYKPGVYKEGSVITLRLKDPSRKVHYTLNGSAPTSDSPLLKDSIVVKENTVVRTFAEGDNENLRSNVATATYLIGVKHDLPIVNITVNNSDLYDYNTGIYADGPGYSPDFPHHGANFWKDWTKNANVEYFDGKEGLNAACGLKIFGGYSRSDPKKSFRLKFRGKYGDKEIDYDYFGTGRPVGLRDIVLRSGAQDYNRCMIRDEFFTSLLQANSPSLLTLAYRPVALYVNGKYFGLYYLREKFNDHYVARHLDISNDSVNIIFSKYLENGSRAGYDNIIRYVTTHSMKEKADFEYVDKLVDLQGLIDQKLGEIYAGNHDVGNVRYVQSPDPKGDRKWHFVYYDLDASWISDMPSAAFYLAGSGPQAFGAVAGDVSVHNTLISRMLQNPQFRELFLERLSYHLANTFSEKNATAVFDNLVARVRNEMKLNCERWPQLSYEGWEKNIATFRSKFKERPKQMLDDIRNYLKITPEEEKKYFSSLGY